MIEKGGGEGEQGGKGQEGEGWKGGRLVRGKERIEESEGKGRERG